MERSEILKAVVPIVCEYLPARRADLAITEATDLTRDLGLNSASVVEIVIALEDALQLKEDSEVSFTTVGDLVDYAIRQRQ